MQRRLNGSRSCLVWKLLGTQETLDEGPDILTDLMRPSPNYFGYLGLYSPQVVEIVRKNVRVLCESVQRDVVGRSALLDAAGVVTQTRSIDDLRLYQMFQRVFSRMLWNAGRGLSDCLGLELWYSRRLCCYCRQ